MCSSGRTEAFARSLCTGWDLSTTLFSVVTPLIALRERVSTCGPTSTLYYNWDLMSYYEGWGKRIFSIACARDGLG